MRFDFPAAFLLLLFLPLFFDGPFRAAFLRRLRLVDRNQTAIRLSAPIPLHGLPQSLRQRLASPVITSCSIAAFLFLICALARPQTATQFVETEAAGRDIMLTLDVSGSMAALDFTIDQQRVERLTALKTVVADFIKAREGDRIGLVVFGTEVFTQCPLTHDHHVVTQFVKDLEVGMADDATAMGDGMAIALKRLREIEGSSKVVVLVTDGMKTAGQMEPLDAARIAQSLGIKIYTIGIGGLKPAPFRTRNVFGFERLEYREVPIDEPTLRAIAQTTGGRYFNAKDTSELANVYREIDALETRTEKRLEYVEYTEHFLVPLGWGLAFLLLAEVAARTVFIRIP